MVVVAQVQHNKLTTPRHVRVLRIWQGCQRSCGNVLSLVYSSLLYCCGIVPLSGQCF